MMRKWYTEGTVKHRRAQKVLNVIARADVLIGRWLSSRMVFAAYRNQRRSNLPARTRGLLRSEDYACNDVKRETGR